MSHLTPLDTLSLAIVGAGPVGLALALQAARALPAARIAVFDKRQADVDVAADPRTLALSLGSVHEFERLGVWPQIAARACRIDAVHVSQQQPSMLRGIAAALSERLGQSGEPELLITAAECGVEDAGGLGAVASYGAIVAPLQAAWLAAVAAEPQRLAARFGVEVAALKALEPGHGGGVEVDAGIAERFDLAVVAEGGVFAHQARKSLSHDYRQTAWVGQVTLAPNAAAGATAYERFTPQGPAALLPLPNDAGNAGGAPRAALVWCVDAANDPVRDLNDAQRLAVLNSVFHARVGTITSVSALKAFPLGLNAERTLVEAGRIVRIGNAAQTLHPVAGQGLNLGLRDAHALVAALADVQRRPRDLPTAPLPEPLAAMLRGEPIAAALKREPFASAMQTGPVAAAVSTILNPDPIATALRRVEWQRAPDRWTLIAATDFLARSFTWRLPGLATARGLGLTALQQLGPVRKALARQMMFGSR